MVRQLLQFASHCKARDGPKCDTDGASVLTGFREEGRRPIFPKFQALTRLGAAGPRQSEDQSGPLARHAHDQPPS